MTSYGLMGVSIAGTPDGDSAYTAWSGAVLPKPPYTGAQVRRCYYGVPTGAIDTQIQTCIDNGMKACVSFNPTSSGTRGSGNLPSFSQMASDQNAMVAYLNTIVSAFTTAGMTPIADWLSVTMNHEPTNTGGSGQCTAAQFQNLYTTTVPATGLTNYAALHAICPVWTDFLGNSGGANTLAAYFPGPTTASPGATLCCDGLAVDYYAGNYGASISLSDFSNVADFAAIPFSIWETGSTGDGSFTPQNTVEGWLSFLNSFIAARIAGSLPFGEVIWFQHNGASPGYNIISSSSDYRCAYLQTINVTLNPAAPPPPPPPVMPGQLPPPSAPVTITYGAPGSALDAVLAASNMGQGSAWPSGTGAQNVALSQVIGTALMPNPDTIPSTLLLQGSPPLQLPSGIAGYVLTSDGSGNLTLQPPTASGVSSLAAGDASIVISGSGNLSIETGTLDQVANLHPPAANWSNNNKKITSVANGSNAQDAVAFGQLAFMNLLTPGSVQTGANTAAANTIVPCNTTGGGFTTTLAAAPAGQTLICVELVEGSNPLTIAAGSGDAFFFGGGPTSVTLTGPGQSILLQYRSAGGIWYALGGWLPPNTSAGNIAASPGTAAAGGVGAAADAGHVHGQPPVFAPTGLTGATAASRYVGATTSGAPASGTFAVGDWIVAQGGAIYVCITAGSPGTWVNLGHIDATATDIAALGTQAAGAIGKAADAGHVHPTTGLVTAQAATLVAGYAKVNGTGTIISWTTPNDGAQHYWVVVASENVAATETGGAISTVHTNPGGGVQTGAGNIFGGSKTAGNYHASDGAVAEANTAVSVQQTSALTAGGGAAVWVAILGF